MCSRTAATNADGAAHVEAAFVSEAEVVTAQETLVVGELAAAQLTRIFGSFRLVASCFPLPGVAAHVEDAGITPLAGLVQRRDQRRMPGLETVAGHALVCVTVGKDARPAPRAGGLPLAQRGIVRHA